MPLLPGRKNIGNNIKTEEKAGKPSKQSIAIALDVARRKKVKKMAHGGMANETAPSEARPMPEERDKDAAMVSRNSSKKALAPSQTFDSPSHRPDTAAKGPKMMKIKHPSFQQSPTFKVRIRDQEDDLEDSMPPQSITKQPPEMYDEEDADKSGPDTPSLHMKMMADGGMINKKVSMHDAEEDEQEDPAGLDQDDDQMRPSGYMDDQDPAMYADGGDVSDDEDESAASTAPDNAPETDFKSGVSSTSGPSVSTPSFGSDAGAQALGQGMSGGGGGSGGGSGGGLGSLMALMAEGGDIHDIDPDDETDMDNGHQDSIVAAIMHRRKMNMMADGGMVDLNENSMEQPNSYYKANEDKALKENYDSDMEDVSQPEDSNEHGDSIESDLHDMVSAIRAKMKRKV